MVKLVTFAEIGDATQRVGAFIEHFGILDLREASKGLLSDAFSDMQGLIEATQDGLDLIQPLVDGAGWGRYRKHMVPEAQARILPPIPLPRKNVFCVGLNYLNHIAEGVFSEDERPDAPEFFTKPRTCIRANLEVVPSHPSTTQMLDYEGELGIVFGRAGINIPEEAWEEHVFGYTIINDVTGRDLQHSHKQWFKGKALDGSCPIGPFIVTKDEVGDPHALQLTTRINGEVRQQSDTGRMIFRVPRLVAELSKGLTIEPGDILATGTPQGVGYAMKPPSFLQTGDEMTVTIDRLGELRNRIG